MQEFDIGVSGFSHGGRIDLVRFEQADTVGPNGIRLPHGHPDVGIEKITARDTRAHVRGNRDVGTGAGGDVPSGFHQLGVGVKLAGGDDAAVHAHLGGGHDQGVGHVVAAVAHERESDPVQGLGAVFLHGQDIGQRLGGVKFVGETIPDRHTGVFRQLLHPRLFEAAVFDAVVHAAQHARGVPDGFLLAELRSGRVQIGHAGALVVGGHLEGAAGTG